ncbi:hypothetical protein EJ04DRAFT_509093 [Polyplosphaeria fusca]|uniref:Spherulation-specific family 4 n=1 Tax=Polyplosphaeria fusca TaxID=682080 RepID=A0A9P4V5M6_9PLEO|nr:hypothetical protein EJ04DRAFT_509093 [Polyplosphaeria fusca]
MPTILLPLYIYPNPGAWDPLYDAISANPKVWFIIIVNPASGPGSPPWWPNADYIREIPRLNAQANVTVVGYVSTEYCSRPVSEVLADIDTYASWSANSEKLGVEGIFFDEIFNEWAEEAKEYLDKATYKVKKASGILGDRLVIQNPGTAIDERLCNDDVDITVIVENTYAEYSKIDYQQWLAENPFDRERACHMVHSVPLEKIGGLVGQIKDKAKCQFVTDLSVNYYARFGESWPTVVGLLGHEEK